MKKLMTKDNAIMLGVGVVAFIGVRYLLKMKDEKMSNARGGGSGSRKGDETLVWCSGCNNAQPITSAQCRECNQTGTFQKTPLKIKKMKNLMTKENAILLGVGVVAFIGIRYLMKPKENTSSMSGAISDDARYVGATDTQEAMCGNIPYSDCLGSGYSNCEECYRAFNNITDDQSGFSGDCGCGG